LILFLPPAPRFFPCCGLLGTKWARLDASVSSQAMSLPDCIIDGEVCALDKEPMPSFAALQTALSESRSENLVFFAFDLLVEGKDDLRQVIDLMAALKASLKKSGGAAERKAAQKSSKARKRA
jgi:bifunctional non-homologous end joining protein LigD